MISFTHRRSTLQWKWGLSNPNQRQIAEATNLSLTTVSFALRDHPEIPPATRARVWAAARALG